MYYLDENAVYFLEISEGAKSVRKIVTGKNNSLYFFNALKKTVYNFLLLYPRKSVY
jgi:hypothetical protein